MEVHAHTHTARRKWTHYFWEFLMLFLAVLYKYKETIKGFVDALAGFKERGDRLIGFLKKEYHLK